MPETVLQQIPYETRGLARFSHHHFSSIAKSLEELYYTEGTMMVFDGREIATNNPGWLEAAIFISEFYLEDKFQPIFELYLQDIIPRMRNRIRASANVLRSMLNEGDFANEESPEHFREASEEQLAYLTDLEQAFALFFDK